MRNIALLFLSLALWVQAATTYYCTANGTGTLSDATSSSTPCNITTALSGLITGASPALSGGDIVYVKAGAHSIDNVNFSGGGIDGSYTEHIQFIATDASWNPVVPTRNSTTHLLDFTNQPVITVTGASYSYLNLSGCDYVDFTGIKFTTSSRNGYFVYCANYWNLYRCAFVNETVGSSAEALRAYTQDTVIDCDIACTGSTSSHALYSAGNYAHFIGCYFYKSAADAAYITGTRNEFHQCIFDGFATYGINTSSSAGNMPYIYRCLINGGTHGIYFPDYTYTSPVFLQDTIITGASSYALYYSNSTGNWMYATNNHFYNNANNISWSGPSVQLNNSTSSTADFRDLANDDYRLAYTSTILNHGFWNACIGPTTPEGIPSPSNVYSNYSVMGTSGTLTLPTAAQVIYDVLFGPDSGTQGNFYVPAEADVKLGVTFGNDNTQYTGEYVGTGGGIYRRPTRRGGN